MRGEASIDSKRMRKAPRAIVTAVAAIALGVLMPSVALADPASKATTEAQALDLFEKGSDAYQKGRFAEAVELLQKAYALKREPVLLYNLGRAYEGLGDAKNAARAYSEYLGSEP